MSDLDMSDLRRRIDAVLASETAVAAAYLYGSAARSQTTPLSDVDVALVASGSLSDADRGPLLRRLGLELGRALPGSRIDLRWLAELPTAIRGRVVTEGRLVHEKDAAARVAAEVRSRMLYHDFLPFERRGTREGLAGLRRDTGDG